MVTLGALGIPFPPCLSRKRQSWEHGHALAIPFPPACRGNGYHGRMAFACDSLFPLPVEEKAIVGWLRFAFSLPVEEKGSIGPSRARQRPRMTPPEHTKSLDCLFPCLSGKRPTQISGGPRGDPPPPGFAF